MGKRLSCSLATMGINLLYDHRPGVEGFPTSLRQEPPLRLGNDPVCMARACSVPPAQASGPAEQTSSSQTEGTRESRPAWWSQSCTEPSLSFLKERFGAGTRPPTRERGTYTFDLVPSLFYLFLFTEAWSSFSFFLLRRSPSLPNSPVNIPSHHIVAGPPSANS